MQTAVWFCALTIVATAGTTGCQLWQTPEGQPIATTTQELQDSITKFSLEGRNVSLTGTVTDLVPLAGGEVAYELKDATGSVWILAKKKVDLRSTVSVRGKVHYQSVLTDEPNRVGVYVEQVL